MTTKSTEFGPKFVNNSVDSVFAKYLEGFAITNALIIKYLLNKYFDYKWITWGKYYAYSDDSGDHQMSGSGTEAIDDNHQMSASQIYN